VTANIQTLKDGPLWLTGEYSLLRGDGGLIAQGGEAWLCRCGQSGNKPFCDGSHKSLPFIDDGSGGTNEVKAADIATGGTPLEVTLKKNGPLRCAGAMRVRDASNRVLFEGSQTALCRCGASNNKPFCDGSHRAAGFSAA
jgi:CDGSH-type Zn-finger protein